MSMSSWCSEFSSATRVRVGDVSTRIVCACEWWNSRLLDVTIFYLVASWISLRCLVSVCLISCLLLLLL